MKNVPDTLHLQKRGNTWHYVRRVPSHLIEIVGKPFIKRSLRTSDKAQAKQMRSVEDVYVDAQFTAAENKLKALAGSSETPSVPFAMLEERLRAIVEMEDKQAAQSHSADPPADSDEKRDLIQDVEYELGILEDLDDPRQRAMVASYRRQISKELQGAEISKDLWPQFDYVIRRGLVEIARRRLARLSGDHVSKSFDDKFNPTSAPAVRFHSAIDTYLAEKKAEYDANGVSLKRFEKISYFSKNIVAIIGANTEIAAVDDDLVQKVRLELTKVPRNWTKHYPGLTLGEAMKRAEADHAPCVGHTSQAGHLEILRGVLLLAVRKKWVSHNAAAGVRPLTKDNVPSNAKRKPFTEDQLKAFFTGKFYQSCEAQAVEPYSREDKAWRFWIPLIMLYGGARPNEIAQLQIRDLKQTKKGIWYLDIVTDIEGGTKSLKTQSSRRRIPLHNELIRFGFLDFVEKRLQSTGDAHSRLFFELKPNKFGNFAHYPSRRFNEVFLRAEMQLGERPVLYSLRHNFRDALRRAKAPSDALLAIAGWSHGQKNVSDDYGDPGDPDIYVDWVNKIQYPGLDLSFLYVP